MTQEKQKTEVRYSSLMLKIEDKQELDKIVRTGGFRTYTELIRHFIREYKKLN